MTKETIRDFYRKTASQREKWNKRNRFYHKLLEKYFSFIIPAGKRVLEVGCGSGDLLCAVKPSYGVGIDYAPEVIKIAKEKYPGLHFLANDAEDPRLDETFDYIIVSDTLGCLWDAQKVVHNLHRLCHPQTRIVISQYNFLWEAFIKLLEFLHLKQKQPQQNWFSNKDVESLLKLENFEVVKTERKIWLPMYIPILNFLFNRILANLPGFRLLDLVSFIVARPLLQEVNQASVTIVVPALNEQKNIENAIKRTPLFSTAQEFIFIEGHSSDNTYEEMERVQTAYPDKNIRIIKQTGKGKGNAVREAFDAATGDILMILDADLTMPPEELPKFYNALCENKGEFINGCRLVYPMEKNAMRFLNLLGNKFFGWFFSYLLNQDLKDTLCGTKVLYRKDYETIKANRTYFGDFDPFGDFDLLFGAAKQNLKITEVIIRYKDREYGSTQISRFRHGILLLQMSLFAARKIKFI
ncbi:bifunctional class I SAM-dependent methyltransferase/glycosyltransferase family 2 protein [Parabacteroides sp. OttesenSCG-928-G07]|nr:bifunctional class I SAM-dependent methyltransferase/glycosyltransferase family 2 protein [Parabacteroides sp. OttesenSCG-928-G21]MDL2277705.1 bifunctional class I SAM-dependent methyltransferase/glycosyltransferase family 2 protein [Parabacteroides sp. OttesenSCG-928-G07]